MLCNNPLYLLSYPTQPQRLPDRIKARGSSAMALNLELIGGRCGRADKPVENFENPLIQTLLVTDASAFIDPTNGLVTNSIQLYTWKLSVFQIILSPD